MEPVVLPEARFRDGLGIRYVRTDATDDPVEVLRPLWDVGAMQNAIRQRVDRLTTFRQARFVSVRAAEVPRDDASTIEVISDFVAGYRLSQYLEGAASGAVSINTSAAIHVLRELLAALALLHESRGLSHGAVGPERILITPKGRVVVADYVLGPAIERLEFTRPRIWREFRIPLPPGKGLAKIDDLADVVAVGMTALALLIGRPIDVAEYPDALGDLLAGVAKGREKGSRSPATELLAGWVKRAVLKDSNGRFANVRDARLALEAVLSKQHAATGGAAAMKSLAESFGRHAAALEAKAAAEAAEEARKAALALQAAGLEALPPAVADAGAVDASSVPAFMLLDDSAAASPEPLESAVAPEAEERPVADADPPVGWRVPETPIVEEALPTVPLLRTDVPATETPVEDIVDEEVVDLGSLAGADAAEPAAPDAVIAAESVAAGAAAAAVARDAEATPGDGLVPEPGAEPEPGWRVLADPSGVNVPTIDVEIPTATLEELVAEFVALQAGEQAPSVEVNPPAAMLAASVPEVEAPAEFSAPAPARVTEEVAVEISPTTEPAAAPDIAAWSFVEELMHHDARFETRQAAGREPEPPVSDEPPLQPAGVEPVPPSALLADILATKPSETLADAAASDAVPDRAAVAAADVAAAAEPRAEEEAGPALPPDWFIEVGPKPVPPPPNFALRTSAEEPAQAPVTRLDPQPLLPDEAPQVAAARDEPPPLLLEQVGPPAHSTPPAAKRAAPPEFEEDLESPVFPRVAPSVRRVRAEARRRRFARIRSGVGDGARSAVSVLASGVAAIAGGAAHLVSAAGRGTLGLGRAVLAASILAFAAVSRGLGATFRAIGTAAAAAASGAVAAGAAIGSGLVASAGWASRAGTALARTAGVALWGLARALAAGARGLWHVGGSVAVAVLGGTAATARGAGRATAKTASIAAAAAGAAGRLTLAAGRGVAKTAVAIARMAYFASSDVADHLPRPVFRPWYLAAALLAIVAVAGVPYARARLFPPATPTGTIRVESARTGAEVTIDGVRRGQAPLTAAVPPGRHRIEVTIAGRTRTHDVDVNADRETIVQAAGADLKGVGSIRVTTDPAGAEVLVDGVFHGTAPLTVDDIAEGAHTVLVRNESGSARMSVRVRPDEAVDATLAIRPGWLAVFAPVKLDILENGRSIGSTERGRILASPGPHTIVVASEALGFSETRQVDVKPGAVAAVTISMPPVTAEVVAPDDAEILVDGEPVGRTPLGPIQVAVGTREFVMRHPTLGERRQVVSVTYTTPVRVVFE